MKLMNFLVVSGIFFGALSAEERGFPGEMVKQSKLTCLYVDEEQILLEDGSIWVPTERVDLQRGDIVTVEGWYVRENGGKIVERNFLTDTESFCCTLDSFVQIEKMVVEKSYPFHLHLRTEVQGDANEGTLGGQVIRSSGNELFLWAAEGLTEEKLLPGTNVLIIQDEKGNKEIIHPVKGECIDSFYPLASVGEPIRRKVVSVEENGITFSDSYRLDFDSDEEVSMEIEENLVESFKAEVSSYNPMSCKIEIVTKEGQSILVELSNEKQLRCFFSLEDRNQEMTVEIEFSAGQELGEALEFGPFAVGEEFLAYPLTFYPIKGTEEFLSAISQAIGEEIDITQVKDVYFLEKQ